MAVPDIAHILNQAEQERRRTKAAQSGGPALDADGRIPIEMLPEELITGGGVGVRHYEHEQTTPAQTWTIPHNLGGYPPVVVVDDDGTGGQVQPAIRYPDNNTVVLVFGRPKTGVAHLSL